MNRYIARCIDRLIERDLDQWNGREAISFNSDGFIGFCGWADTQNSQPFLNAFRRWMTEYMLERSR